MCCLQVIILKINSASYNRTMDTMVYEVSLVMDNTGLSMASAVISTSFASPLLIQKNITKSSFSGPGLLTCSIHLSISERVRQ